MNRRNLLKTLIGLSALSLTAAASHAAPATPQLSILIQESPLAGFQYHAAETVWQKLQKE